MVDAEEQAKRMQMPTLVMLGSHEGQPFKDAAKWMNENIPGSQGIVEVPMAGHASVPGETGVRAAAVPTLPKLGLLCQDKNTLTLRRPRSGRLEGWATRTRLCPSFETRLRALLRMRSSLLLRFESRNESRPCDRVRPSDPGRRSRRAGRGRPARTCPSGSRSGGSRRNERRSAGQGLPRLPSRKGDAGS